MVVAAIASIASFFVSERVLKPKATALFIVLCILAYDLRTKTHDVTALRVYRGPAFLAFTLMMVAYSLRTWRRNGVACDELLFWPGTTTSTSSSSTTTTTHDYGQYQQEVELLRQQQQQSESIIPNDEADKAAGGGGGGGICGVVGQYHHHNELASSSSTTTTSNTLNNSNNTSSSPESIIRQRRRNTSVCAILSMNEYTSSTEDDNEDIIEQEEAEEQEGSSSSTTNENEALLVVSRDRSGEEREKEEEGDAVAEEEKTNNGRFLNHNNRNNTSSSTLGDEDADNSCGKTTTTTRNACTNTTTEVRTRIQHWGQNHPRITWLGTFFFFRSNTTSTLSAFGGNASYAPSGPSVFGASLDLSVPVLFNFHLFIIAFNQIDTDSPELDGNDVSEIAAKLLPIIFFTVLIFRTVIPPGRRFHFWGTMKFFFTAPLHKVSFRDEFIGEIFTSWIRPGQDLFFAISYYLTVIYGTISRKYNLMESGDILEESWLLHNVLLPTFSILPLFLKYLQTLRQCYDTNKRWPYQANSFKYLTSTLVIIYGITHPDRRTTAAWIISFFVTMLYQIMWDVFMDWELFEIRRDIQLVDAEEPDSWCNRLSSLRPSSHVLLKIQMYAVQPILDFYQRQKASIPSLNQIQLRSKRLYKTENFYWKILFYNCITRWTWMLCFLPAYHISRSRTTVLTSTSDVDSYWGVLLPAAEIVRRTLWGLLFVERETIKLMDSDSKYDTSPTEEEKEEDVASKFGERTFRTQLLPTWLDNQQQISHSAATSGVKQSEYLMRQLFVAELYGWAAAFVILGFWAATTTS